MNFQHQSRSQDLEEKKLLLEQLKAGLMSKVEVRKAMHKIDEAAQNLALAARGEKPRRSSKASASSMDMDIDDSRSDADNDDEEEEDAEDEEEEIYWGPPSE